MAIVNGVPWAPCLGDLCNYEWEESEIDGESM
jgi:hypothetical protein